MACYIRSRGRNMAEAGGKYLTYSGVDQLYYLTKVTEFESY